ncbi:MAG: tetratricopeptide repeat protein [Elainellaceae cyanobacterium]
MTFNYKYSALFLATILSTLGITSSPILFANPVHSQNTESISSETRTGAIAPLLSNLGDYQFPISTNNILTQHFFNQGMILAYGFNHAEAARSFREAARHDSTCAMCYWGLAYSLGPNINAAMEADDVPTAYDAIQQAIALKDYATEREQAYIWAMADRYVAAPVDDRSGLDLAYTDAMRDVAQRYPNDADAQTLFAEALMDTMPWDYWTDEGEAKPDTLEVLNTLESAIEKHPDHIGALHFYIHAVEKERPELGIEAADRLGDLAPGAGHLVHMPSHIYIRVGRYHDAVVANQVAAAADQEYVTQCHAQGIYPAAYMPHNHHFLNFAAIMAGQKTVAMESAHQTSQMADQDLMRQAGYGTLQHYYMIPLYTMVQFDLWDEILAEPAPAADLVYPTGVWHYARGMAFAAKGQVNQAQQELTSLTAIASSPDLDGVTIWDINTTAALLDIASEVLAGEIAVSQGDYDRAIAYFQRGVELEDRLNYDEPAPWSSPVRQNLGAVLLKAGRPAEAEQAYREDLAIYANNGWSLYGLAQSLRAQGKSGEAETVQRQFEDAWQYADITLVAAQ